MASQWELMGTNQLVVTVKQTVADAESLTFFVNQKNAYSILGGYIVVLTAAGGSTCDVLIGSASVLETPQVTTATGTFALNLSDTASALEGSASEEIKVTVAGGDAKVLVTLFVRQAKPQSIA